MADPVQRSPVPGFTPATAAVRSGPLPIGWMILYAVTFALAPFLVLGLAGIGDPGAYGAMIMVVGIGPAALMGVLGGLIAALAARAAYAARLARPLEFVAAAVGAAVGSAIALAAWIGVIGPLFAVGLALGTVAGLVAAAIAERHRGRSATATELTAAKAIGGSALFGLVPAAAAIGLTAGGSANWLEDVWGNRTIFAGVALSVIAFTTAATLLAGSIARALRAPRWLQAVVAGVAAVAAAFAVSRLDTFSSPALPALAGFLVTSGLAWWLATRPSAPAGTVAG